MLEELNVRVAEEVEEEAHLRACDRAARRPRSRPAAAVLECITPGMMYSRCEVKVRRLKMLVWNKALRGCGYRVEIEVAPPLLRLSRRELGMTFADWVSR